MTSPGISSSFEAVSIETCLAELEDGRKIHQGWSPQCDNSAAAGKEWGVLKTTSIQAGRFEPEHNKRLPAKLSPRPHLEVRAGDILLTCAEPRHRCGISCLVRQTRERLMISGKMYRFRANTARIRPEYLETFLQTETARHAIDRMKTGISDSGLNLTHDRFRQLTVPLAPLPQQERIVAEIEKQFTRLDAGVASLRRVQTALKRYRASVLKAACEGRLVPTEAELAIRENRSCETGEQLLQRILKERREKWNGQGKYKEPALVDQTILRPLPRGWAWTTLGSLLREPLRNGHSAKSSGTQKGLRAFTLSAVTEGDFSDKNTKPTVATPEKVADLWAEPGDIYVERSNTPELVGISRLYRGPSGFAFIPDLFIRVRVQSLVSDRYIELCLLSHRGRAFLRSRAQGISGTMPKIDQETVGLTPIPLPPLAEQQRIAVEADRRSSLIEEFEMTVAVNLKRSSRLRGSVLAGAFGQTTASPYAN
jgi:type I restriction enzyme, S subunit